MAVRFTSRIKEWTSETETKLDFAMLDLATDIHREASILAPKDKRILVKSGRISREGKAHYKVIFGGSQAPYARIQHEGGTIKPKNKPYLVFKTTDDNGDHWVSAKSVTIKGTKYLEKPGDAASRNFKRYIRHI